MHLGHGVAAEPSPHRFLELRPRTGRAAVNLIRHTLVRVKKPGRKIREKRHVLLFEGASYAEKCRVERLPVCMTESEPRLPRKFFSSTPTVTSGGNDSLKSHSDGQRASRRVPTLFAQCSAKGQFRLSNASTPRVNQSSRNELEPLADLLLQIFSDLYPQDLLNLDRTCLGLHRLLLDHRCWERTFQNVGLPPCPPDLSPHQYATLVFNPLCQVGASCSNRRCRNRSLSSFVIVLEERKYTGCAVSDAATNAYMSSMYPHN